MTELLGLAGRKVAGKDTFARLLIEEGERQGIRVVRAAFADKMKVSAARSLGYLGSPEECVAEMDALKEGGYLAVMVPGTVEVARRVSGREFLQWFGTEGHRDVFGQDFWVDALLPLGVGRWEARFEGVDLIVVSDCRFVSEAERVRSLGGRILRIGRDLLDDGDQHASEAGLPVEYIHEAVDNNGTIEDLRLAAAYWLRQLVRR